ncbi:cytochrome c oxidase subunit 2A [Thalassobacillus devorans]|nr:cytochrome c oxidase subunit 2A [Thalassobacillus devorans]
MPNTNLKQQTEPDHSSQEPNLKGTLISVSIVGGFLVLSWLAVFGLFLAR